MCSYVEAVVLSRLSFLDGDAWWRLNEVFALAHLNI